LVALTGTLIAQTPQASEPKRTIGSIFESTIRTSGGGSMSEDGNVITMKGVTFEFTNGLVITADDVVVEKGKHTARLSGNVQMTVK